MAGLVGIWGVAAACIPQCSSAAGPLIPHSLLRHCTQALVPPSCRPRIVSSDSPLPKLFFLAGVEGAGHELFERFFANLNVNLTYEKFEPDLHLTFEEGQKTEDPNYLRARDPFPMGRIRTPLARPDLVSLALFDGILYDLKVLVLVHEPREMVAWSVARKYDGNDVGRQVRMVEDSLVYLDASVRMLHCGSYAVFDTPLLSKHPDAMVDKLTEFLELPVTKEEVHKALRVARTEWLTGSAEEPPLFHGKR
eukprot:SM000055S18225  [mRNA]  locus=s55:115432:117493:+ [translate_table: standard]